VVDWNEDGLLDLLVGFDGNGSNGGVWLYLNSGTTTQYQFTDYSELEADGQIIGYMRAQIQVGDINFDGKKDLLLGNGLVEQSRIYYYENIGTNDAPVLAKEVALKYKDNNFIYPSGGYDIYFCLGDWNADGGLDILWTDYYGDAGMKLCLGDVPVSIDQQKSIMSKGILRKGIVKNGFYSAEIILKNAKYITLDMMTADGRKVALKDIGNLHAGEHTVSIDINQRSSGVYFVRLIADNICLEQKRLLFIK
jgi:hypothetical protein